MIGKEFGKWTVLKEVKDQRPGKYYKCKCECGDIYIVQGVSLRANRTKQCRQCQYHEMFDPEREINKKYYKWTVLKYVETKRKLQRYECQCECGLIKICYLAEIRAGKQKQCYICHNREVAKKNITHGKHGSKIYKIWHAIKGRCLNESDSGYKYYGARGITICERWLKFENFYQDVGDKPDNLELDRINNNGNYEPNNVHWVTHKVNCQNTRRAKKYRK